MSAIKLLLSLIHPLEIVKKFTLWGGGGGGGGGSSTGTQTNITELPEWARGYAKNTLEKTAALSEKPYQTYGQDRIAGFSPMQVQSQQDASNMTTNAGTGAGMNIAGAAALGGLNQNYNGMQARTQNFNDRAAGQYMNPYAMSALQPTLNEQARQSQIQSNQLAGRAVGQGAFGGSRQAIEQAENSRNLGIQQGNTIAQGMNTAYNNATQQFNADQARQLQAQQANINQQQFGANLGLQGLNTALQGAGQLGVLGQQQFQQGMDINKLQNAYGGQQQALRQQGLDLAYQDFQNEQNYPYKQLGFMSDMIRGLPVGQQSTQQIYTPNSTTAQNVAAIGTGAYGLSKFMAEGGLAYAGGGEVKGYAGDNGSVTSSGNVEEIVHELKSDQELQQALKAAQARGDMDELEAVQSEMAMRASLRKGIAGGVTNQMATRMAGGGGVLAFAGKGSSLTNSEDDDTDTSGRYIESKGDPTVYGAFGKYGMGLLNKLENMKAYESLTPEQRDALDKANYERIKKFGGEDPYAPMAEKLKQYEADRTKNYDRGLGFAALQAVPKILQGGNAVRGIAGGLGEFGAQAEQADKANIADQRALASMGFNLADAQRKERMASGREAIGATKDIEANRLAAHTAERADIMAGITGAGKFAQAYRPVGGAGGAGSKLPQVDRLAGQIATQIVDLKGKNPNDPQIKVLEDKLAGLKDVIAVTKTSDTGPNKLSSVDTEKAAKEWGDTYITNTQKKTWAEANGIDTSNPMWPAAARAEFIRNFKPGAATPAPAPAAAKPQAASVATPLPANATAATLKDGTVYDTVNGPAKWNAKTQKFVAQ